MLSTPTGLSVTPTYSVDGSIKFIDVEFIGVVSWCTFCLQHYNIMYNLYNQDVPMNGVNSNDAVTYTILFGPQSFTGVTCSASNHCTLRVNGSQLTVDGLFNVSVVAFNAVGSGPPATFPTEGIYNIDEHICV